MPSFASREYWDQRFSTDSSPFDWLVAASVLCDVAERWVGAAALRTAEVLHIGCGSSNCRALQRLVAKPSQIHNVDYSCVAVDAARVQEQRLRKNEGEPEALVEVVPNKRDSTQPLPPPLSMRWSCLDLLSLDSVLALGAQQLERGRLFGVILDKSTSDSIACGSDVHVQLPYPLSINGWSRGVSASAVTTGADIHPLHLLAIHLGVLTTPRTGKWIAISYSEDRFPFLPPYPQSADHGMLPDTAIKAGFPHPNQLWTLEAKEKIEPGAEEESLMQRRRRLKQGVVHRPQVAHWLYVLARTSVVVTD